MGFAAMLETLYYLSRGGRIGKAAYMVGSMIKIKPIVTIDKEGVVAPLSRARGEHRAFDKLVDCIEKKVEKERPLHLAVMHADVPEQAAELQQLAQSRLSPAENFLTDFTPVMGAHAGPGVLGLGYYYE